MIIGGVKLQDILGGGADVFVSFRGLMKWRPHGPPVSYAVKSIERGFWFHFWTPMWHDARGPYVSIGCGRLAFYRGY